MRKKFAAVLLAVFVFCSACIGTVFAATTTNGLEVDLEITSELGGVVYLVRVGETSIYLEAESGGKFWPLDTANPFAATVCTVVDANGNELGTLESTDGVIDWSVYPDAAQIICTTDFVGDTYVVVIADVLAIGGGSAEDTTPSESLTMEITTANSDTAYLTKLAEGKAYVEVLSGGKTWVLDTANPFAPTVCTVVDANGNELGILDSTDGVIDWSGYPDAAKIICTTDYTGDVYEIDVAAVAALGTSAEPTVPSEPVGGDGEEEKVPFAQTPAFGKVMNVIYILSYIVMVLWVIIWIVTVTKCYKDGIFGTKRRAKKCPVNGVWNLAVTTPHGANEGVIEFKYDGNVLHGTLNDKFNQDSKAYEGKMTGPDSFECLIKIDIGMGTATEFLMKGSVKNGKLEGEMVLAAMSTIKSAFTAEKKG